MCDLIRILLSTNRALHETLLSEVINLCYHCLVMITKRAGEEGVNLWSYLLWGRFT